MQEFIYLWGFLVDWSGCILWCSKSILNINTKWYQNIKPKFLLNQWKRKGKVKQWSYNEHLKWLFITFLMSVNREMVLESRIFCSELLENLRKTLSVLFSSCSLDSTKIVFFLLMKSCVFGYKVFFLWKIKICLIWGKRKPS